MGSKSLPVLKGASSFSSLKRRIFISSGLHLPSVSNIRIRKCLTASGIMASLQPPDVLRLAETARISLTPGEVEELAPKIGQVVDWFGQLQTVDLQSMEPFIRADSGGGNQRNDAPETFENREAMIRAVPAFDEPYIKVPKVLNKE
ncbi:glutamyl-tRNA(Gln) amidotransferase subunit C, chloroplastic/mitochondrial-like [Cucurbita maxima]|uniref:Glutamyl-tRNA(Gln) amidotransferase subunit C, chloroplastic/mitochondrial n=1 Tax=Cucurbita maxima TaxID=3661 RepID=A0A6J1IEW2_CUCMA|nr:glutamyl-tRNA(Gln) amidotransferase subunit C, chloroplastic/mitochondrial-like [Cucurbita maxima]